MNQLSLGFIGAGFISQVAHIQCYANNPRCQLHSLADNRADLLSGVAQHYSFAATFDSHLELLQDDALQAVVIALPRRAQPPIVELALQHNKPVLTEKPLAYTAKQGMRLIAAAESASRPLVVGFMKRHDPVVRAFKERACEALDSGSYGKVVAVVMTDFNDGYGVAAPQHQRSKTARSFRYEEWPALPDNLDQRYRDEYDFTLNVAVHDINLLHYLFGADLQALSFMVRPGRLQSALIAGPDFEIALHVGCASASDWRQAVEITFEQACMKLDLPSPMAHDRTATATIDHANGREVIGGQADAATWAFQNQADAFVKTALDNAPNPASATECLADLRLIEDLWSQVMWRV